MDRPMSDDEILPDEHRVVKREDGSQGSELRDPVHLLAAPAIVSTILQTTRSLSHAPQSGRWSGPGSWPPSAAMDPQPGEDDPVNGAVP